MGNLTPAQLIIQLSIALILGGALAYLLWKQRQQAKSNTPKKTEAEEPVKTLPLQLQAYERLILLVDRIALPSVISRSNQPGIELRDMQFLLVNAIKQEYEHNVTQQIYVSNEAWEAVRNLKEQNIHVINQVASFLPPEASGTDLNKHLLEMIVNNPKVSLHNVVSEVLSYEAKKLMK
ncbi:MAG: hypothetical protein H7122_13555 [Chitinophagaceae bacterium]|nr:hypothetical protein [Chitinophagaceae bacterium]